MNRKHKVLLGLGFGASLLGSLWLALRVRMLDAIVEQLEAVNAAHVEQRDRFRIAIRELTHALHSGARGLAAAYRELGAEQEARADRAARCVELERECEALRRRAAALLEPLTRAAS